jgi:hypothetical protein
MLTKQQRDLLQEAHLNAIGLGDEERREGLVHHRAVEVERAAERQHEAAYGSSSPICAGQLPAGFPKREADGGNIPRMNTNIANIHLHRFLPSHN